MEGIHETKYYSSKDMFYSDNDIHWDAKITYDGFHSITYHGGGTIIGKIINSTERVSLTVFMGNTIKFYDQGSFTEVDNMKKHDLEYLRQHLKEDTAEDHIEGYVHIVHFEENHESIKQNKQIPQFIRENMYTCVKNIHQ